MKFCLLIMLSLAIPTRAISASPEPADHAQFVRTALDTLKALRAGPRVIGEVKQGSGKVTLTDG